ncbi:MAG: transketolase, partial [Muribaculaceae bacterium]|nr:transketolase [Muribaculaceae bacterium]
ERFLVARFGDVVAHKTFAFISDGGIQEEISQGAGRLAGHLGLANLIMFYDSNNVQLSTDCDAVTTEDTAAKYRSWNWNVLEVDGTDPDALCRAIEAARAEKSRPSIIIGHTVMGRGCVTAEGEPWEGKCSTHGQPISKAGADYAATIRNLGGDAENPWVIFDDVKALFAAREAELKELAAKRKAEFAKWEEANPELAAELADFIAGRLPEIDFSAIEQKPNAATRNASATVLSTLAEKVKNMIVASADLANSDKTDGFLKKTRAFARDDFGGAFLQAGVAELTMACIMNGIALHGGLRGACGTFFVFSDYMKPAVRIAALMELPVVYVWTHDAFRVGEDGPTHEPIEQEAQIRLMEQVHNFAGRRSMLVLRPADAAETSVAWKMALENDKTPTALILSRQDIPDLPALSGNRFDEAMQAERGGYVVVENVNADITLVANGSEVSLLCQVAELLKESDIEARVVSVPSIGLFRDQDVEYQESVIPSRGKVFGLTAGLPSTLENLVGRDGRVVGMTRFGASAPYKVLDEKFGFTPEAVAKKVLDFINA